MADEVELDILKGQAASGVQAVAGFRDLVNRYLQLTGTKQTEFGEKAAGSADFVRHLRAGRDFRATTLLRVLKYMRDS